MANLEKLQQRAVQFRNSQGWQPYNLPREQWCGAQNESGEAGRYMLYWSDSSAAKILKENSENLGNELSDILLWLLLIIHDWQLLINLPLNDYHIDEGDEIDDQWPRNQYLLLESELGKVSGKLGIMSNDKFLLYLNEAEHRQEISRVVQNAMDIVLRLMVFLGFSVETKFSEKLTQTEVKYRSSKN